MTATDKPVLYVDLDNTLVDFRSGIERLPSKARAEYGPSEAEPHGHYDDAPGIFALIEPMPGGSPTYNRLTSSQYKYLVRRLPCRNRTEIVGANFKDELSLFGRGDD